ncbi:IS66 family insertion sequence element accessory protein TnpB [Bradyrhizobium septentrionale]|uniref:IS66 family insertion sequence element accessory protein TnpB n=1 Tax=Bradyrhizobium septentrionale TaxID=1404411 RepID=A0ABZ2NR40_9BRAD
MLVGAIQGAIRCVVIVASGDSVCTVAQRHDLCLFAKRLEDGIFRWPKIEDGVMRLSAAQLSALLEGLDWRLVHEARATPAPTQAG